MFCRQAQAMSVMSWRFTVFLALSSSSFAIQDNVGCTSYVSNSPCDFTFGAQCSQACLNWLQELPRACAESRELCVHPDIPLLEGASATCGLPALCSNHDVSAHTVVEPLSSSRKLAVTATPGPQDYSYEFVYYTDYEYEYDFDGPAPPPPQFDYDYDYDYDAQSTPPTPTPTVVPSAPPPPAAIPSPPNTATPAPPPPSPLVTSSPAAVASPPQPESAGQSPPPPPPPPPPSPPRVPVARAPPSPQASSPDVNPPPQLNSSFSCDEGDGYQWIELDPDAASQSSVGMLPGDSPVAANAVWSNCSDYHNDNDTSPSPCCSETLLDVNPWWQYDMGESMAVKGVEITPPSGVCCRDGVVCAETIPCASLTLFGSVISVGNSSLLEYEQDQAETEGEVSKANLQLLEESARCNMITELDFEGSLEEGQYLPANIGCGMGPGAASRIQQGRFVSLLYPGEDVRSLQLCGIQICAKPSDT